MGADTSVAPALDMSTLFMPMQRGYGSLLPFQYAMTQDPALKSMVANLSNLNIATQMHEVYERVNDIILKWGGASNLGSSGSASDQNAARVAVMQHLVDKGTAVTDVDHDYSVLFNKITATFLAQGLLHNVFPQAYYDYQDDKLVLGQTYDEILVQAKALAPTNPTEKAVFWNEVLRVFQYHPDNFNQAKIEAAAGFPLYFTKIFGTSANDILTNNIININSSNFQGFAGDDIFNANGPTGLLYNIADGNDTINTPNSSTPVTINFGSGITFNSLTFKSTAGNIIIGIGTGSIKVSYINNISSLVFSDGTVKRSGDINVTITGTPGDDILSGTSLADTINGLGGNDTIIGSLGADIIDGGTGVDIVNYSASTAAVNVNLSLATAQSGGDAEGDTLANIENIVGSAYADTLTALATGSTIYGGAGADKLYGGAGNDIFISGEGEDIIDGGSGIDTASYADALSAINIDLRYTYQSGSPHGEQLTNIENIIGSDFNDSVSGNTVDNKIDGGAGNDYIAGDAGADIINGGAGDDSISGGSGADTLNGDAGIDSLSYASSTAGIIVNLALNTASGGDAAGDIISNFENVSGSNFNDSLTAIASGSVLYGYSGNDSLIGGVGNDMLTGGAGADIINGGDGIDTVDYSDSPDPSGSGIGVNVNLALTTAQSGNYAQGDILSNIENIIGSYYDDTFTGTSAANKMDGGNGSDTMSYKNSTAAVTVNLALATAQSGGYAQGDILSSIENLTGSAYDDTLTGNENNNILIGGVGADVINGMAGIDTVSYSSSTAAVNVNLSSAAAQSGGEAAGDILSNIENATGSAYADTLTAIASGSTLNGLAGNDILNGGNGNDIIFGGAGADTINGGAGIDTISYFSSTASVNINLTLATAQSGGEASGDLISNIENIIGTFYYNDTLIGNSADNVLAGGFGNNVMDGGAGIDTVSYADAYSNVNVNLSTNTGQYLLYSYIDTITNIENIVGSIYNDTLVGNNAANTINGGKGSDSVTGGSGADIFVINKDASTQDTITDFSTSTVGEYISLLGFNNPVAFANLAISQVGNDTKITLEDLQTIILKNVLASSLTAASFGGSSAITGTVGNDVLVGTSAADIINALDGNDTITGGLGADNIDGGLGIDAASYADSASLVNVNLTRAGIQFGGTAQGDILTNIENIIGSNFADILAGNAAANNINGGTGIDKISYADSTSGVNVNLALATAQSGGYAAGDILSNIESILGSAYNDIFAGNSVANNIDGGAGIDSVSYASSASGVTVNLALATAQSGGDAAGDVLANIENVTGSAYADTLTASATGSILTGAAGVDTLTGGTGNDTFVGGVGGDLINGGAGIDTVSYSDSASLVNVNLTRTGVQFGGSATNDVLSNIENLTGSNFADILVGNTIANIISGGTGKDTMTGGTGADIFKYSAITDSGAASGVRDIIADFSQAQADKIDLGNFAGTFAFKGTGAFTGTAHEINYAQVSGNTIVGIDADGNGVLDFQIEMTGLHNLAVGDFVL